MTVFLLGPPTKWGWNRVCGDTEKKVKIALQEKKTGLKNEVWNTAQLEQIFRMVDWRVGGQWP